MIAAAFICGPDGVDDCFLPHKLRVMSLLCDAVFVVLDRSRCSEPICRRFPKVQIRHIDSLPKHIGMRYDGVTWSEGMLRQAAWDFAIAHDPEWIILGDTDEVPAPGLLDALKPDVDCLYADWVNLIFDVRHAIGGTASQWSYQKPGVNKKAIAVRHVKGRDYRYRLDAIRHVRLEPSPLHESATVFDETHRLGNVPMLHYKWAYWDRWIVSPMAALPHYQPWPPMDAEIVNVPDEWLWD